MGRRVPRRIQERSKAVKILGRFFFGGGVERSGSTKTPCRKMSSLPLWWRPWRCLLELMLDYPSSSSWIWFRKTSSRLFTIKWWIMLNLIYRKFDSVIYHPILGKMTVVTFFQATDRFGNQYIDGQVTSWRQNRMIDFPSSKQTSIAMDSIVLNIGSTPRKLTCPGPF